MAAIDVKMSQAAWDYFIQQAGDGGRFDGLAGTAIAILASESPGATSVSFDTATAKISAGKIEVKSPNGGTVTYVGAVSKDTPTSGTAAITSTTVNYKNKFQETTKGKLDYTYQIADGQLTMTSHGKQFAYYKFDSQSNEGPFAGRGSIELTGNVTLDVNNSLEGKIHSLGLFNRDTGVNLKFAGDIDTRVAQNSFDYEASGRIDSVSLTHGDKSYLRVSGPVAYTDSTAIGLGMLGNPSLWSGDDTIRLVLPPNLRNEFSINAGDGNDVISVKGGGGYAHLYGGNGNDRFLLQDALSIIDGGEGDDTIESAFSYSLASASNVENLTLTGKASANATGNEADNVIIGNAGKNILFGAGGKDLLKGGAGDDTYQVDFSGEVTIDDASGKDSLEIASPFASMTWNGSTLEILGGRLANFGAWEISGDSLPEFETHTAFLLNADKAGAIETVHYRGDGFSYRLSPNQLGSKANDLIVGTKLDDTIRGLDGNDRIEAGKGNDLIIGGKGKNLLWGGEGIDTFKLERLTDSLMGAEDELVDFEPGVDKIDLSSIDANTKVKGLQAFTLSETGPAAHAVWFGDGVEGFGFRLCGDVNGDAKADFVIELAGISSPLATSDFIGLA